MVNSSSVNNSGEPARTARVNDPADNGARLPPAPSQLAAFTPNGYAAPAPARSERGEPQPRGSSRRAPTSPTISAIVALKELKYPPNAFHRITAAAGPTALITLYILHEAWHKTSPAGTSKLREVAALYDREYGDREDVRAETLTVLLKCHAALTEWGCSNADLLSIANWFSESDPSRAYALKALHDDIEWLREKGYEPEQMCPLAERSNFLQILGALHECDDRLRQAGLDTAEIAYAAGLGATATAADAYAAVLGQIGYSPKALDRLEAGADGLAALRALYLLDKSWSTTAPHSSKSQLLAAVAPQRTESGSGSDARAEALTALLECHAALTKWGCTNADLLSIVNWFYESDPSRANALRTLRDNTQWLTQKGYDPEQMCVLAERSDFVEIMRALYKHDAQLRRAGLDSTQIARAAANGGAPAIAALADKPAADA